jgi:ABC-type uncharacterized transport system fused permease/ATPase subunit
MEAIDRAAHADASHSTAHIDHDDDEMALYGATIAVGVSAASVSDAVATVDKAGSGSGAVEGGRVLLKGAHLVMRRPSMSRRRMASVSASTSRDTTTVSLTASDPIEKLLARVEASTTEEAPIGNVVVFGPSSCGKSAIARVLAGLWPLASGRICRPTEVCFFKSQS